MNPLSITPFMIPAFVAVGLITLLIRERYYLLPKKTKANNGNGEKEDVRNFKNNEYAQSKRYPDDFVDLSGGTMGI